MSDTSYIKYVQEANDFFAKKNYAAAYEKYNIAIQINNNDPAVRHNLRICTERMNGETAPVATETKRSVFLIGGGALIMAGTAMGYWRFSPGVVGIGIILGALVGAAGFLRKKGLLIAALCVGLCAAFAGTTGLYETFHGGTLILKVAAALLTVGGFYTIFGAINALSPLAFLSSSKYYKTVCSALLTTAVCYAGISIFNTLKGGDMVSGREMAKTEVVPAGAVAPAPRDTAATLPTKQAANAVADTVNHMPATAPAAAHTPAKTVREEAPKEDVPPPVTNVNTHQGDSMFVTRRDDNWAIRYVAKAGETVHMVADRFYVAYEALIYTNEARTMKNFGAGSVIYIPVTSGNNLVTKKTSADLDALYYRTGAKDDMDMLSVLSGVSKAQMKAWNNLPGNTIHVGDVLFVGWVKTKTGSKRN